MRTTVTIDDALYAKALEMADADMDKVDLLTADQVYCHPMVISEIACGTPPERSRTIAFMGLLHQAQQASHAKVLDLIEREDLFGQGCGLVDIMLLASTMLTPGLRLWTALKA